jgi:hypothetical protein
MLCFFFFCSLFTTAPKAGSVVADGLTLRFYALGYSAFTKRDGRGYGMDTYTFFLGGS